MTDLATHSDGLFGPAWERLARTLPARPDLALETALRKAGVGPVAGADEAGRGCLAGPVVAAAVILPEGWDLPVDDSKKLSAAAREELAPRIRADAVSFAVALCTPAEIDRFNILRASLEAMRRAVAALDPQAGFVLVDGNRTWPSPSCRAVVAGDARSRSIAAASILAKTERDRLMEQLAMDFPGYGWERNRGYPTPDHFAALARLGVTPHHRRSFNLRVPVGGLFDG